MHDRFGRSPGGPGNARASTRGCFQIDDSEAIDLTGRFIPPADHDVHVGQMHAIHVPGTTYHAAALSSIGIDPPEGPLRALI